MPPRVLILEAERDELVPKEHGDALEARCKELGLDATRQAISGALHMEVLVRSGGSKAVAEVIQQVARECIRTNPRPTSTSEVKKE
jgi:acetyl esterase/lipase